MKSKHQILLLSALLFTFSCKKENNPLENNTLKSNPLTFIKNIIGLEDNNAIKKDKDGKYTFGLILEKEDVYKINTKIENNQVIKMQGQDNSTSESQYTNMDFKVKEILEDGYKLEAVISSIVMKQKNQGEEIVVDTDAKLPAKQEIQAVWKMQKAITKIPFYVTISKKAKVKDITGLEELYTKVENKLKIEFKPEELKMIIANIQQSLNKELLKAQFENGLNKFPENPISIGETWSEEKNIAERNIKNKITFKLESVENNEAIISVVGKTSQDNHLTDKKAGIKQDLTMNNNSTGKIIYNADTGWIQNSVVTENIVAKQSMTQLSSNKSQSMEMTAKRSSTVN